MVPPLVKKLYPRVVAHVRPILAMLSVQSLGGLVFGTATGIDGMTLHFELDARMEAGDIAEWRMELPGLEETAMGMLRILAGRKEGPMPVWVATIQSISPDDAEIFEVWRRGVEHGTRAFSHSSRAPTDSWLSSTTMVGSTDAERKLAVANQEERRKRRLERAKTLARNSKSWPDPEDREGGRSAASSAFRQTLSHSTSRSVPHRSSAGDGADSARGAVAAALRQGIVAAPLPVSLAAPQPQVVELPEPTVFVDRGMASLQFPTGPAWTQVHRPALLSGTLHLKRADLGVPGRGLSCFLVLPNGTTLPVAGRVGAPGPEGSALLVELDANARRMVEIA